MSDLKKYEGVIPAFYACYDDEGEVSPERTRALVQYFIDKGVQGLYVNGSSGECIYQSVADRKLILEEVMAVAKGKLTIIAHVACNNTKDSMELARHAESLGVDAIATIPPIYFRLPESGIARFWNDISAAAPNTDFIIYNIVILVFNWVANVLLLAACTSGAFATLLAYFLHKNFTWKDRKTNRRTILYFFAWNIILVLLVRPILVWFFELIGGFYEFCFP